MKGFFSIVSLLISVFKAIPDLISLARDAYREIKKANQKKHDEEYINKTEEGIKNAKKNKDTSDLENILAGK